MHDFLSKKLEKTYDSDTVSKIIASLNCDKKTTFRVNHIKSSIDEITDILKANSITYEISNDYNDTFIIDGKLQSILENLPVYKEGKIYIQSISSMIPVYVLDPKANENILDMCSAPGSKTTLIQSIGLNKVNLTAVELHKDRFERLKYNLGLQGANAYLFNMNAMDLDDNLKFDKILLDAPCSGSGILDLSNDKYEKYFTDTLISKCVKTQKNLISKASKLVRKDGIVIYSTCSLLKEENEEVVEFASKCGLECVETNKIFPDSIYEGFFVAKLIKK